MIALVHAECHLDNEVILRQVEEEHCLVFVLIDEVESLTAARKAAVAGSEPADAIRAVNALLTHARATLHCAPGVTVLPGLVSLLGRPLGPCQRAAVISHNSWRVVLVTN